MDIELRPADIVLVRGDSLGSRLIRFFTRSHGEPRSCVNHVGVIVVSGSAATAELIESVSPKVRQSRFARYLGSREEVAVARPLNLSDHERDTIVAKARTYLGQQYGWLKVVAHGLDWALRGIYFFRRLPWVREDNYPICSWLVAHAYKAAGKYFDVDPGAATPDDIWDFVEAASAGESPRYEWVVKLQRLPR